MKHLALIIVLGVCVNCKAQSIPNSFKSEIIDFYISSNEIEKTEKESLINGFDESFTIRELGSENSTSVIKNGIYTLTPNISHTTTILLAHNVNGYKILSSSSKYETLSKVLSFLKENSTIDKLKALEAVEDIMKLLKDNEQLTNLNVLEFKEN